VIAVPGPPVKVYVLHGTGDPNNRGELFVLDENGVSLRNSGPISLRDTSSASEPTLGQPLRITRNRDGSNVYITYDAEKTAECDTAKSVDETADKTGTDALKTCSLVPSSFQAQVAAVTPDGTEMLVAMQNPNSLRIFSMNAEGCPGSCVD